MVSEFGTRTAGLYAGSFDPLTNGHLDVVRQASRLFDHLIVAIGVHPGKQPLFDDAERRALVEQALRADRCFQSFEVVFFSGLVVHEAQRLNAKVLVRGLRDGTDLNYEMQMAGMNACLEPSIQTIFIPAGIDVRPITATLVRQIAKLGGDVSKFVPPVVADALKQKFARP